MDWLPRFPLKLDVTSKILSRRKVTSGRRLAGIFRTRKEERTTKADSFCARQHQENMRFSYLCEVSPLVVGGSDEDERVKEQTGKGYDIG
ncbi:hypothetical protein PV325_010572 [Microctonus aethiopoides]|nr:hypothetical protein PV325_010572 [Microctonus aethiopoides]KAK0097703.1 hypothetical protein PV326_014329 [Microctonus aethiopoides]